MLIGDGNNMVNSLIVGCLKVGMEVSVVRPGCDPHPMLAFARGTSSLVRSRGRGGSTWCSPTWAHGQEERPPSCGPPSGRGYQVNEA